MSKSSEEKKHITRISAKSSAKSDANAKVKAPTEPEKPVKAEKVVVKTEKAPAKTTKTPKEKSAKKTKKAEKTTDGRKPIKEVKLLARPFVALGRYIRDSWHELRLVRWPDRKATWKMTLAVLVYCAIMMIFILLLDTLFTFLFNLAFK